MNGLLTNVRYSILICLLVLSNQVLAAFDRKLLADIKKATVYIKVTSGVSSQSGTGFLIKRMDDKGIIVTNSHVASLNTQSQKISVVFNSGLNSSKRLEAKILALNDAEDLAFLEVPASGLPKPIVLTDSTQVSETEEVYIFGFPFGAALSTNTDTPTVTVAKGTISSKRLDINEQLDLIQIDGDINPGNSGGPITNKKGELLGVSVSAVRKTNIGFAIPSRKVLESLGGKLGDLSVRKQGFKINIVANAIDPLKEIEEASLLISQVKKKSIPGFLQEDGKWGKIGLVIEENRFRKNSKKRYVASFGIESDKEKTFYGQIYVKTKTAERYQSPFMITNQSLSVELSGVDIVSGKTKVVLGEGSSDGDAVGDSQGGDEKDKLIRSLLVKSGIDAQIKALVKDAETLLEDNEEENEEVNQYTKRLVAILNENWDEDNIRNTYVEVFKDNLELGHLHSMLSMFESETLKNLHPNLADVENIEIKELREFKKKFKRDSKNSLDRNTIIFDIESHRKLSELVIAGIRPTSMAISRVINEAGHRGGNKSDEILKKQVEDKLFARQAGMRQLVYLIMKKKYEKFSEEEISQYLEIVKLPAFKWYIEQEKAAYETIIANNVNAVNDKLYAVFIEMQKEALGLKKVVDTEGLTDVEVVSKYIEEYGIGPMSDFIIAERGGVITISKGGAFDDHWGKPRKDFLSPESILQDIEKQGLSMSEFIKKYDKYLVDSQYVKSRIQPVRQSSSRRSSYSSSTSSGSANARSASCRSQCAVKRRDCMAPASDKRRSCLQARRDAKSCSGAYDRARKACEDQYNNRCLPFCPK